MTSHSSDDVLVLAADAHLSEPNSLAVKCPNCGEAYGFHIDGVEIENASGQVLKAEARGEDSGAHLIMNLGDTQESEVKHDGRRHQISLLTYCESCGTEASLTFKQHKGTTYYSERVTRNLSEG